METQGDYRAFTVVYRGHTDQQGVDLRQTRFQPHRWISDREARRIFREHYPQDKAIRIVPD